MLLGSLTGDAAMRKGVVRRLGHIGALGIAAAACGDDAVERNPSYLAPVVSEGSEGRVVRNLGPAERWIAKRGVPRRPVFLFSGVLAVARATDGTQAVLPPDGDRLLVFDRRGRFAGAATTPALVRAIAVTTDPNGWLVVERDGRLLGPRVPPLVVRTFPAPATATRFGDGLIVARSPFAASLYPEPPGAPLLAAITAAGEVIAAVDTIVAPTTPDLATITNAGHVAAGDSLVFFAFLTRDELRAYDSAGRRRWMATRSLRWPRAPSRPAGGGEDALAYEPVNLAVAAHRGVVYTMANSGPTADSIRVDGFDGRTGLLLRSATLPAGAWLISTDGAGGLWYAPADTLAVIGTPPAERVVELRLPTFDGDSLDIRSFRGKIMLLNFWASWCRPCRDEFPHMAALFRELGGDDFTVVAVSDDLDEASARRFLDEFDPPFPVAWARGTLERQIGYRGLPFTLLVDREGRVVQRYFGFGGAAQIARLRSDVRRLSSR